MGEARQLQRDEIERLKDQVESLKKLAAELKLGDICIRVTDNGYSVDVKIPPEDDFSLYITDRGDYESRSYRRKKAENDA